MTNRTIFIAIAIFAVILVLAGIAHLAFRSSAQLYLNMHETDEKQTKWIGELYRKVTEIERKQAVFEQHLRIEAEAVQKEKAR